MRYEASTSVKTKEEENLALARKSKLKSKKKGSSGSGVTSKEKKESDLSNVKCFYCHKLGHFASQCLNKKKNKSKSKLAASTNIEYFSSQFEEDFGLIACVLSSMSTSVWDVDSGMSFHMTGCRDFCSSLHEENIDLQIELGDNGKYQAIGCGTITFQRESRKSFQLYEASYVLGLSKNLMFVSTIEDKGYVVTFLERKVYISPKGSKVIEAKVIGVRKGRLYQLQFDRARALISTSVDLSEAWHRKMVHLHHGMLNVLKHVVTRLPKFVAEKHDPCKGFSIGKYIKGVFPPNT